ncbi:MAG: phosphotransferase [Candidatus Sericytochromatia bacterium]|nr:phosphotransferase [Candidatus Tanganyikabacteria bacterium]
MWIDAIERRLFALTGQHHAIMQVGLDVHWQDKILLFCWRPGERLPALVCRVSRTPAGSAWLRAEAAGRMRARAVLDARLRDAVPWVRALHMPFGTVLVEPWIPGHSPPAPRTLEAVANYGSRTLCLLRGLGRATRVHAPPQPLSRAASRMLGLAARRMADPEMRDWVLARRRESHLLDRVAPCVVHGDFWRGNLRESTGVLRILDWEFMQGAGNPYFDAALNLLALCRDLPGADPVAWLERCFLLETSHSRLLGRLLDDFGAASREACALTVVLALIEHAARDRSTDELHCTLKYRLLARMAREADPVGTVRSALWPESPSVSAVPA